MILPQKTGVSTEKEWIGTQMVTTSDFLRCRAKQCGTLPQVFFNSFSLLFSLKGSGSSSGAVLGPFGLLLSGGPALIQPEGN